MSPPPRPPGSHDGREFGLMLAGAKPAAMFCDPAPGGPGLARAAAAFAPHVAAGRVAEHRSEHRGPDGRIAMHRVVYTLPGEGWRAAALHALHGRLHAAGGGAAWDPERGIEVSLLLGYATGEAGRYVRGRLRAAACGQPPDGGGDGGGAEGDSGGAGVYDHRVPHAAGRPPAVTDRRMLHQTAKAGIFHHLSIEAAAAPFEEIVVGLVPGAGDSFERQIMA